MCGALTQSQTFDPYQTRLLQPTRSADLRARDPLARRPHGEARHARWVHAGVVALGRTRPGYGDARLWLVGCLRMGRTTWYLLTARPIATDEGAWRGVFA